MSRFLSERYRNIKPYIPGEQLNDRKYIKLNTNESPFPPSPKVLEAINRFAVENLNLYPDPELKSFTATIAEYYGLDINQILITNGSDEALYFTFEAFCDKQTPPCFADITYGFYKVYSEILSLNPKFILLENDYKINSDDYKNIKGTIFIANPNAPTGILLSIDEIEDILKSNSDNLVVVDEAYIDFGGESTIPLIKKYENLVVIQTFSKSRSLAGGRIGFAAASFEIIEDLKKMKFSLNPYSVNRLSALAGEAAIRDVEYFESCRKEIIKNRDKTEKELISRGFDVLKSSANFIFAAHPKLDGKEYYQKLKENNILIRYFNNPRTERFVRISIGSAEQMKRFIETSDNLKEV